MNHDSSNDVLVQGDACMHGAGMATIILLDMSRETCDFQSSHTRKQLAENI